MPLSDMKGFRFMKRRDFVKLTSTIGAFTILTNPHSVYSSPSNDLVNLAVIGCGSRSDWVCRDFLKRPQDDVRFSYCCDVDLNRARNRMNQVKRDGMDVKVTQDARVVFDDKSVDAVVLVTPDHWHALHTIQACEAGKDVYVEKPLSRTAFEGEMMIRASQKYNRIVGVGNQTRSAPYCLSAKKFIEEGNLGEIEFVRVNNMWNYPLPTLEPSTPVPDSLNWDRWVGPSPYREFSPTFMKSLVWSYFWDYGNGVLATQGIHQIDVARWILGLKIPKSCCSWGGFDKERLKDQPPSTNSIMFDFGNMIMNIEQMLGTPYMLETDMVVRESDMFPYWYQNSSRIEIYGTRYLMVISRLGAGWQVFDRTKQRQPVVKAQEYGRYTNPEHMSNFVDAIKERKAPNSPVEEGHLSAMLVHYANASLRVGGVKLDIDQTTGKITNCPDTMQYLRPEFRKEYDIPEIQ